MARSSLARDAYAACLKLAPQYLGARVALSHVLRTLGDSRAALREAIVALSQAPGDGDALYAVALAQNARGDGAAARRSLEAFLATSPEFEVSVEARALLASLTLEAGPSNDSDDEDDG